MFGSWSLSRSDTAMGRDVDELIEQWTRDPADDRDRRLMLMRTAHLLMAPGIVVLLPCSCGIARG